MSPRSDTRIISRYGWDIIVPFGILTLLLLLAEGLELFTFILLLAFAFLLYIHRNPERISNYAEDGSIIAPIDGKVKHIISIDKSPIDGKPGFEVVVESSYTDTGVLRVPVNATMHIDMIQRGSMLSLDSSHANLNERAEIRFSSKRGDVLIKHLLGAWARPLRFIAEGKVMQNHRYGFMLYGTSSIFLPSNSRVAIKEGMSLTAGESIIGFFSETA